MPDSLITDLQSRFQAASTTVSPLILDLDRDGIETLSTSQRIHFDHDGNRYAETSGWVAPDDGLLVWDRNGNGTIDDGSELFGNYNNAGDGSRASNGFTALAALDDNGDGTIDAADAAFSQLRIWKDADSNAVVGKDELLSLDAAGVQSLGIAYVSQSIIDAQGNQLLQAGSYVGTDGDTHAMVDAWFASDTARTVDLTDTPINDAIAALPDLPGFGNVPSLHQAMARDGSGRLQALVTQFAREGDGATRHALMQTILFAWTGSDRYDPDSRGTYIGDGRTLHTLEAFLGQQFMQSAGTNAGTNMPGPNAARQLADAYQALESHLFGQLLLQTHFQDLLGDASLVWDSAAGAFRLEAGKLADTIGAALDTQGMRGALLLEDVTACLRALGAFGEGALAELDARDFQDHPAVKALASFAAANRLFGTAGNDTIRSTPDNDLIIGGAGSDVILGAQSDGADIILFGRGDGVDTLRSSSNDGADLYDSIAFQDVASTQVDFTQQGEDLLVAVRDTGDAVLLERFFSTDGYSTVTSLRFADGAVLDRQDMLDRAALLGTEGDDQLRGYVDNSDRIHGLGGDDVITGSLYADILDGGDGNDTLDAGIGDDVIIGGHGDDLILGQRWDGADTIRFARGDGADTIDSASDYYVDRFDHLQFDDIASTEVDYERIDADLCIRVHDSADQILLKDFFGSSATSTVTGLAFADGVVLDRQAVLDLAITSGTDGNDSLYGYEYNASRIHGLGGDDRITGSPYADILDGGGGNDTIRGGSGDDAIIGGQGDDLIIGNPSDGADVIRFARGDGADTIDSTSGWSGDMVDTLDLSDYTQQELRFARIGNDLQVQAQTSSDHITLAGFFTPGWHSTITNFRFADGALLDRDAVSALAVTHGTDDDDTIMGGGGDRNTLRGLGGGDTLYGGMYADFIDGGDGNDTINGNGGNDNIIGGGGNDVVYGDSGDDVIDPGSGNDSISGGDGSDTIRFGKDYGSDTITDGTYYTSSVNDTVVFTDIASTDADYRQRGADLIVLVKDSSDSLTINNFFNPSYLSTVKQFQFADNVTVTVSDIKAVAATYGDAGNNNITGFSQSANRIYGLAGNDTLDGAGYTDILFGGDGNDALYGNGGDDVLDGGAGNDSISGGDGADTIRFGMGYGADKLTDASYYTASINDTVVFTDIASTEADYRQQDSDLVVLVKGSTDNLTVSNFFNPSYLSTVKQFQFSDGVTMSANDVKAIAMTYGDANNNIISGYSQSTNRIYGLDGNDTLYGGSYADLIDGGDGNDTLYGEAGDDTILGGAGNDLIYGDDGNNLIDAGTGNDIIDGGDGADTIRFGKAYGADQFLSSNSAAYRLDTIDLFDLTPAEVELARIDDTLQIRVKGTDDSLTIGSYFTTSGNVSTVKQLRFQDGSTWDDAAIKAKTTTYGNDSGNTITGYDGAPNTILGLADDDTLAGGSAEDLLIGGRGNDRLNGKTGNDTYLYGQGDGADTITDYDTTPGNIDTLTLGPGINRDKLWLTRNGNDLDIRLLDGNANDHITVANWYADAGYHIEQIKLADGVTLLDNQVNALVDAMAAFAPPPAFSSALPQDYQTALAPVIAANWK